MMTKILWLWIFLETIHLSLSTEWPLKRRSLIEGDLILGGFFPVHRSDNERMCGKLQDEGLIQLEAMLFAVEEINKNSSILPGVRIGVIAVDSCDCIPRALEEAVDFAKGFAIRQDARKTELSGPHPFTCGRNVLPHFESGIFERVVAIIGGHSSWVSRQIADLMRMYKVPQVSYQSTSPVLSEIGYEYFFRTVPPLTHQMKVIVDILSTFNWKYFAVVYSDSVYGNKGLEVLKKLMLNNLSLCISSQQRINVENSRDKDYDFVMSELLKRNATAVIVFGDHEMARNLMSAATRSRASKRFVWIGSTAWVGRKYVVTGNEDVVEGAMGIIHDLKPLDGFRNYLKSRHLEAHRHVNPWFAEYWEEQLNCRVRNFSETPFNRHYSETCSDDAELPPSCYEQVTPSVQFVRDAVYSVAQALHDIYNEECKGNKLCLEYRSMIGEEMRRYLSKVEFEDENKNIFRFDEKGDGPARYTVVNLQRFNGTNELRWVPVGSYYKEDGTPSLKINSDLIRYKQDNPIFPESYCSSNCKEGQAMILLDEANCCWHCTDCLKYQYVENGVQCKDCPKGTVPNARTDGCEPISPTYMDFPNSWAVGCIVFSLLGILMTLCVAGVVAKYWDTPIIVSSGRAFSFSLLVGIILSFSLSFAIVSKPSAASCGIIRFFHGVFYTISYATIAAKTRYLSRLSKRKEAKKKPKHMNIKSLILIVLALIAVEGILNATWLLHSPPATDYQYPSRTEKVFICKGSDTAGYLVGLVLPFMLMVFCTVYALRIREFNGAFHEARYINFTNYTTLIVWLAFLPMFLLNNVNLLRVVVLSLLLNVSALVQLVCLFLPKVYVALRRPEKNKHDNVVCYDVRQSVNTSI